MKRFWLLFSQSVTVLLAAYFVVGSLKPEWLGKRSFSGSSISLIEAPASLAQALNAAAAPERLLLVDCLTLWLVGFLTADGVDEARWRQERAALLQLLPQLPGKIVLVSNEIGWGVVPMGAATRWFVDELGWLIQAVAARCQRVTLVAAGLPLVLKAPV